MSKLISIIIPIYNVEKYIDECLDSVLNQTYKNLEIILIDDGSTDSSGLICDKYVNKDSRIKVIHQKNSGAGAAKNAGLRIATGDYLTFVDSDDFLEKDAYEYMSQFINDDFDIVQCAFNDLFINKKIPHITNDEIVEYTNIEYLERFTKDWTCCLLWDKLYKRELFENIYFEEGHIVDDEYFTYQGVMNAKKVIYCPKIIYNYRKRKSSVTLKPEYGRRIIFDKLDYLVKRKDIISKRYSSLKKVFDVHYVNMLLFLIRDEYNTKETIRKIKNKMFKCIFGKEQIGLFEIFNIVKTLTISDEKLLSRNKKSHTSSISIDECFD